MVCLQSIGRSFSGSEVWKDGPFVWFWGLCKPVNVVYIWVYSCRVLLEALLNFLTGKISRHCFWCFYWVEVNVASWIWVDLNILVAVANWSLSLLKKCMMFIDVPLYQNPFNMYVYFVGKKSTLWVFSKVVLPSSWPLFHSQVRMSNSVTFFFPNKDSRERRRLDHQKKHK